MKWRRPVFTGCTFGTPDIGSCFTSESSKLPVLCKLKHWISSLAKVQVALSQNNEIIIGFNRRGMDIRCVTRKVTKLFTEMYMLETLYFICLSICLLFNTYARIYTLYCRSWKMMHITWLKLWCFLPQHMQWKFLWNNQPLHSNDFNKLLENALFMYYL